MGWETEGEGYDLDMLESSGGLRVMTLCHFAMWACLPGPVDIGDGEISDLTAAAVLVVATAG